MHASNKTLNTLHNLSQLILGLNLRASICWGFDFPWHCGWVGFKPHCWHFCSELNLLLASIAHKSGSHLPYWSLSFTISTKVTLHTGGPQIHPSSRREQHVHYMQEIPPVVSSTWMNKLVIAKAVEAIVILLCCMSSSTNTLRKTCFFKSLDFLWFYYQGYLSLLIAKPQAMKSHLMFSLQICNQYSFKLMHCHCSICKWH